MAKKVLVTSEMTPTAVAFLEEKGYEVRIMRDKDPDHLIEDAEGCEGIVVQGEKLSAEMLERLPASMKVIGRHGVGYDSVDVAKTEELGIILTNAPLSSMNTVAEHTVALIVALAKNIIRRDRDIRESSYAKRRDYINMELEGKTVGIIGVGRIGVSVAKKCVHGFGMKVVGYDPVLPPEKFPEEVEWVGSLEELCARADFVTPHMPLLPFNDGLFNKVFFEMMKPTAYFINTSRGKMVNEGDLYEALVNGTIAGAGIDVFEPEPPSLDNPLFDLDSIIVSAHIAGHSPESQDRMGIHAAMGVDEVLSGKPVSWQVNKPVNPRVFHE